MDNIYTLTKPELPFLLQQITDPPKMLYVKGKLPKEDAKMFCIVGARKHSSYGEEACKKLISGLKGYNICIVSGLALGIDSIAHRSAMENGLQTIAFPGSGLDPKVIYPPVHRQLAEEIVYSGGALLSELEMMHEGSPWTFPQRNRLMAGISHATLVIEAELKSGTLITSKFATEYNRDVGAVPGPIFSSLSEGPNQLIDLGAKIIRNSDDILEMLGFARRDSQVDKDGNRQENSYGNLSKNNSMIKIQQSLLLNLNGNERKIIEFLQIEPHTSEQLLLKSGFSAREINEILSSLEIQGLISERSGWFRMS